MFSSKRIKHTAGLIGATGAMMTGMLLAAPASQAAEYGIDMARACVEQYGDIPVSLRGGTVFDWKCVFVGIGGEKWLGIDVFQACRSQHGDAPTPGYRDFNNPYSWYCHS